MDAKTRDFLDSLKADGFNVSSLETQINSSPVLEQKAKMKIGGSVLRQETFTRSMQDANATKQTYETKIRELAAAHDTSDLLKNGDGNNPAYIAALEVIANHEKLLLDAGYSEEDIKELSYKDLKLTPAKVKDPEPKVVTKEKDDLMPQDMSKYIDVETLEKQSEMGVYVSVGTQNLISAALEEARDLGIKVPREKILSLTAELKRKVDAGENVVNIIDQHFDLPTARIAYTKATHDKEIAEAREAGRVEGLKESGTPSRRVTRLGESPVTASQNIRRTSTREPERVTEKDVPRNKYGDAEVYRTRRSADDRVSRQIEHFEKVTEGTHVAAE